MAFDDYDSYYHYLATKFNFFQNKRPNQLCTKFSRKAIFFVSKKEKEGVFNLSIKPLKDSVVCLLLLSD
jgi:hypothetical protein